MIFVKFHNGENYITVHNFHEISDNGFVKHTVLKMREISMKKNRKTG